MSVEPIGGDHSIAMAWGDSGLTRRSSGGPGTDTVRIQSQLGYELNKQPSHQDRLQSQHGYELNSQQSSPSGQDTITTLIWIKICILHGFPCKMDFSQHKSPNPTSGHFRRGCDSEISHGKPYKMHFSRILYTLRHVNNSKYIAQSSKFMKLLRDGFISQLFSTWGKVRSMWETVNSSRTGQWHTCTPDRFIRAPNMLIIIKNITNKSLNNIYQI